MQGLKKSNQTSDYGIDIKFQIYACHNSHHTYHNKYNTSGCTHLTASSHPRHIEKPEARTSFHNQVPNQIFS